MQTTIHAKKLTLIINQQDPQLEKQSNVVPFTGPEIGKEWPGKGGVVAGIMPPEDGKPGYYLIVPTDPKAEAESLKWGRRGHEYDDNCARDGKHNTDILAEAGDHPAAEFCANLELGGFDDYYLPSRREASLMAATVPHLFNSGWYWTSTQYSAYGAFGQHFDDGGQYYSLKFYDTRVRAVRREIIN